MKANSFVRIASLVLLLVSLVPARAQWLTQTSVIPPGWSAVYLNVDASGYGQTLDQLVGSDNHNPIDQIWLWRGSVSAAQFISDPQALLTAGSYWLTWMRSTSVTPNVLESLVGNSGYMIHSSASTNYTWRVKGQPVPPSYVWDMTGLNFIGFSTPTVNPPDFDDFLAPANYTIPVELYEYTSGPLVTSLNPELVLNTYNTPVTRGQAYWMEITNVNNTYFGPFNVNLPNPKGMAYGTAGGQVTLNLNNMTTNALTVFAQMLASEVPPAGQTNIVGAPPLLLRGAPNNSTNAATVTYAFTNLANNPVSWTLPPSGQAVVVLGVNRYAMTASPGSLYAGILQFTDSLGYSQINVPVSAQATSTAGLWVGSASVSQVGSYLKTYATNADGSLLMNTVTNYSSTTNAAVLLATNLVIFNYQTNSQTISQYNVSNLVVSLYTTNALTLVTNGAVVVTNLAIQTFALTNTVITSIPTNPYVSGGSVFWQALNTTNVSGSAYALTNWLVGTNFLAVLATANSNGTPVVVTNTVTSALLVTNLLTTNGLFLSPVTYQTVNSATLTAYWVSTNLAYNVLVTNAQALTSTASSLTGTQYAVTNPMVITSYAITNYYVTNQPVTVVSNPPNWVVVFQQVNNYAVTNLKTVAFITNRYVITNSYVLIDGATNFLGGVTNQTFSSGASSTVRGAVNSATTNLDYFFLPMTVVSNTPVLVTNAGSYVVTSLNTNLGAVPTAFPLRLILHSDGATNRLLQRVYYGLRQQTNTVVATTESVLDTATLKVARRISASQLPWTSANAPWISTSHSPLGLGGQLQFTVTEPYDDQTSNPFLHTYHPDHNNLSDPNPERATELLRGAQSYDIIRQITLTFASGGTDFGSLIAANSGLSGTYNETITLAGIGSNQRTFTTAGTFSLTLISPIATLTTH